MISSDDHCLRNYRDAMIQSDSEHVVITCAITGGASREQGNVYLPYTPEELAEEARRAVDAGAAVIHLHGRDPVTGAGSHSVEHIGPAMEAIRAAVPDAIINLSAGGLSPVAERINPVTELRPELATCALGSYNYASWRSDGAELAADLVVGTTFGTVGEILTAYADIGVVPDLECYELGHLDNLTVLARLGIPTTGDLSFVLGVVGNLAADPRHLGYLVDRLGSDRHWTAIVIDASRHWQVLAAAVGLGGWIRVGFEDCHWLDSDTAATSNGQLVERAAQIVASAGRSPLGPAEARSVLGVSGRSGTPAGR